MSRLLSRMSDLGRKYRMSPNLANKPAFMDRGIWEGSLAFIHFLFMCLCILNQRLRDYISNGNQRNNIQKYLGG